MFRGSIPADMQKIVFEIVSTWTDVKDIYVGCSGNFTVERTLIDPGKRLHGNDVSLFTSVIGACYANQDFRLELNPEVEGFDWLLPYMKTPTERVAVVMLLTRFMDAFRVGGEKKDNAYYERLEDAYRRNWDAMFGKTHERVKELHMDLASYWAGDVLDFIDRAPPEAGFISYPPFGPGEYTNFFKKLESIFIWDKPKFQELTDELLDGFFKKVTDRDHWVFGVDRIIEEYRPFLRGMTRTTNRGIPIYVYSSGGPTRIVTPEQLTEQVKVDKLKPGQEIGGKLTLAPLNYKEFQALRSMYMNIGIRPGSASLPVAVLVDGYLIGVYAFSVAPSAGSLADVSRIYLLSDFPVRPTDYPRLAKLVLYAALSKESKLLAERAANRRIRSVLTTAFSNRPQSMKYRGIFKLHNRKELDLKKEAWGKDINPDMNDYYAKKFELNYLATMGEWSLAEGLAIWNKKHGEREVGGEDQDYQD